MPAYPVRLPWGGSPLVLSKTTNKEPIKGVINSTTPGLHLTSSGTPVRGTGEDQLGVGA